MQFISFLCGIASLGNKKKVVVSYLLKFLLLLWLEANCIKKEGGVKKVIFETENNSIVEAHQV